MQHTASPLAIVPLLAALGACGAPPPPAENRCPIPSGAGVVHAADVTRDETWRAADGPHVIRGRVAVRGAATLTLEPCAELRLEADASLDVGTQHGMEPARLVARGTAERPITLRRAGSAPWGSLAVFAPARAELAEVTVTGAGADPFRERASVYVFGPGVAPNDGSLAARGLTVRDGAGPGVVLAAAASFVAGSTGLRVAGVAGHPLVSGQHALGTLPDGDLRDNAAPEVLVREDQANGYVGLQTDVRARRLSVPYRVGTADGEPFRVGSSALTGFATLTLDPGVELRFHPGVALRVITARGERSLGAIRALGTAAAPVRLTSARATPRPGDWPGIYYESPIAPQNELAHVEIAWAGGDCSCSLVSCSPVRGYEGAVVFDGAAPPWAFVHDSVIRDSAGHGFVRSWLDRDDMGFVATNRFERLAGCPQTAPMRSGVTCPRPADACGEGPKTMAP